VKIDVLRQVAADLKAGKLMHPLYRGDTPFMMRFIGKVVGKERPRFAGGHAYTPKETREFEKAVRGGAEKIMRQRKINLYRCSVAVHLTIFDPIPEDWPGWMKVLASCDYIHDHSGADMDNREKAVLDALNNVVYEDDRQVVKVYKFRLYSAAEQGFFINIEPVGLTKNDLDALRKMLA
jgi:Holliday junction resolvase RusA-like endonuclease